ncbi:MAG TPA: hypothetical protein VFQ61_05585 [Polyangiaceae bacterium]|nr:hypothetical protein [Polyangiaceae bacterium]
MPAVQVLAALDPAARVEERRLTLQEALGMAKAVEAQERARAMAEPPRWAERTPSSLRGATAEATFKQVLERAGPGLLELGWLKVGRRLRAQLEPLPEPRRAEAEERAPEDTPAARATAAARI